jgi:MFS transporter, PPP family, 3-phenylpropionic acid transporter
LINEQSISPEKARPKRLWVVWLLFFFQFAGIGVYFTFLNVYYRQAGLSGTQIGFINMATALVAVVCTVFWGYLSDRTGNNRALIAIGAVGALITAQFVPQVHTFGAFLVIGMIGSLLGSAPNTLIDSTTLALLGDRREEYGRYRLGGTIGYIITTLTVGFVSDRVGLDFMFPAYGVTMAIFAIIALRLPAMPVHRVVQARAGIGRLIRTPAWVYLMLVVLLCWIASNASITFMGVSLQSMGATQSLIALAVTVGAIIEIPFMLYSGAFLRRYGPVRLLFVAMILMIIRYSMLGWMPVPAWAIAINMLNGPSYTFFWNSSITYANKMAPPNMAGTVQGLFNSTVGLAGVVSALLAGMLFDRVGPNGLFTVMAFVCLAALILFAVGNFIQRKKRLADRALPSAPIDP